MYICIEGPLALEKKVNFITIVTKLFLICNEMLVRDLMRYLD